LRSFLRIAKIKKAFYTTSIHSLSIISQNNPDFRLPSWALCLIDKNVQ